MNPKQQQKNEHQIVQMYVLEKNKIKTRQLRIQLF